MGKVRGIADLGQFKSLGQPSIKIIPKREVCARYGPEHGGTSTRFIQAAIAARPSRRLRGARSSSI